MAVTNLFERRNLKREKDKIFLVQGGQVSFLRQAGMRYFLLSRKKTVFCSAFFLNATTITTRASPFGIPRDIYSGVAQNKVNYLLRGCCISLIASLYRIYCGA